MILGAHHLRFEALTTWLLARRSWVTVLLCLTWMLAGLGGHDPWKPREATVFGVVLEGLSRGDWLVPTLAGEPYLYHPPLYYRAAGAFGSLLHGLLPLHDAVRWVNAACAGASFLLLAATVARLCGAALAWLAPLVLLGCVGWWLPAHQLLPENALLLAQSLTVFGLSRATVALAPAALGAGCGIGVAFLSHGVGAALPLLLATALLPLAGTAVGPARPGRFLLLCTMVALPWLVLWPLLLWVRDPAALRVWWGLQQAALPGGGPVLGWQLARALAWLAWPALPFALLALWQGRRRWRSDGAVAVPGLLLLTTVAVLALSPGRREVLALPLLVPLALLATAATPALRRGAVNAFFWFGIAFFALGLTAVWFYFGAVEFGLPARAARHMARMEPGYASRVPAWAVLSAATLSLAWLLSLFNVPRAPQRPFVTWASGSVALWSVLMLLMGPWADHAKSYRPMLSDLRRSLPPGTQCVAARGLGESQRALVHYHTGTRVRRLDRDPSAAACPLLLVEGRRGESSVEVPGARLLWEGHRAGDRRELFRLYRRTATAPPVRGGKP